MKPVHFDYARQRSLDEVLHLLASRPGGAKLIAGGQSLMPMMNFRFAQPELLIDINALPELDYHRREGDFICIGALTRHATLRGSALIRELCPLMAEAYQHVAHVAVRNRGTLCGNLSHADPASEMPAVMLATEATLVVCGQSGRRQVPAADFFQGVYATALEPDEMLVEVRIPVGQARLGHGFEEVSVRQGDYALTLTAALLGIREGRIEKAVLALAGVADRAMRLPKLEAGLVGKVPSDALFAEVGEAASLAIIPSEVTQADAVYRRDLIRALVPRALTRAAERAAIQRTV